ncbi:hypothetical protein JCM11251_001942 [Rhodosporidiobolus azoricus]
MANYSGIAASLSALVKPSILQPRLSVPSIAHLDWHKLKHQGGVTGVVIDKDNCIAKPGYDSLAPDPALRDSWTTLLHTFGPENVLVVSNSAGTLSKDPLLLQAESVSRNLGVPVLVHGTPKPGPACVKQVAAHFLLARPSTLATTSFSSSEEVSPPTPLSRDSPARGQIVFSPLAASRARLLPSSSASSSSSTSPSSSRPPRILVIGDRLATDMILSHRLSRLRLPISFPSASPPSPSKPNSRLRRLLALFRRSRNITVGRDGDKIETIAVLTTTLHAREGLGTTLLRGLEKTALWGLQRAKRRRVRGPLALGRLGRKGTEEEGAEGGRAVEEIEWEKFLTTYEPPAVLPSRDILQPAPLLANATTSAAVLPARETQNAPSPSPPTPTTASPPATPPTPILERLQSLPTTLSRLPSSVSTTLSSLPSRLRSYLLSLPPRLLSSLKSLSHRLSLRLQSSLPLLLASLHKPLSRLVQIYTQPASLAGNEHPPPSFPERRRVTDLTVAWTERAVEAAERRLVGPLKGLRVLAEARAEELGRLRAGLPEMPGLGSKAGRKGVVVERGKSEKV